MFRLHSECLVNPQDVDPLNHSGPVVMRPLSDIPGIKMAAKYDDFFGMLASPDLTYNISALHFGKVNAVHLHAQLQQRIVLKPGR